jgi:hypothetical protein
MTYQQATAARSTYVENVLTHGFLYQLSREAWKLSPGHNLQIAKAEVDDSGYDVVLTLGKHVRYIQLKQAHHLKKNNRVSIQLAFSRIVGSCIVVIRYHAESLEITGFHFYGSKPTEPMLSIDGLPPSRLSGRIDRNTNMNKIREHYRDIPHKPLGECLEASRLLAVLFPELE